MQKKDCRACFQDSPEKAIAAAMYVILCAPNTSGMDLTIIDVNASFVVEMFVRIHIMMCQSSIHYS